MEILDVADFTGFLIRRAQQAHADLWRRFTHGEISSVQFGTLHTVGRNPGIDQRTLGSILYIDRSTVADVVRRLERRGLLERVRDEHDGRRNLLRLTAGGKSTLSELEESAWKVNEALLEALPQKERAQLHQLLSRLLGELSAPSTTVRPPMDAS